MKLKRKKKSNYKNEDQIEWKNKWNKILRDKIEKKSILKKH